MKKVLSLILPFLILVTTAVAGETLPLLRISSENTESHIQTKTIQQFVDILGERTRGELNIEYYPSARLYRDEEVIRALAMNKIEMAVPGTWIISNQIPEVNYFLFPGFFGASREKYYSFEESPPGKKLTGLIEMKLDAVIPGDFLDLGHAHIFTSEKPIHNYGDFSGLTIRVAGGSLNRERVEAFGARGVIIPWPDLPHELSRIDGFLTTFETVRSARLWELGVRYAFLDNEYFPQYIPLISRTFWNNLSLELRGKIVQAWGEVAAEERLKAEIAQKEAMEEAERNGIIITRPDEREVMRAREILLLAQEELVDEFGLEEILR